ncbi:MAG: LacI family DNA-binding transcriptional regulator [Bacillota bacterium]
MVTIADVATEAGVSTATVSRVLNENGKVALETRQKVNQAIEKLDYNVEELDDSDNEVTIKDVAAQSGVSEATVSRVINKTVRVRDETRAKVEQAINDLNYSPNANARHLRSNKTKLIGLVIPDIWNSFFGGIVKGVEDLARENDYNVVLCNTSGSLKREKESISILKDRRADGLIYMGQTYDQNRSKMLEKCSFPIVAISREEKEVDYPTVNIDNYQAAYDLTEYLIKQNYNEIAFIAGPSADTTAGLRRTRGYKQALLDNDLDFNHQLKVEGNFTLESGYRGMEKILAVSKPDAVFAANDEMAIGAMKLIKERGYSVPKDIAVVGFDNISLSDYVEPRLTTIEQPIYELGQVAMDTILNLIEGAELEKDNLVLDYELLIRESS